MTTDERRPTRASGLWRAAPFVVAGVVAAAILRRYSPSEIAAQMRDGHALAMVPWVALFAVGYMVLAAAADTITLRSFGAPRWRDVVRGKAAAATLTAVGYVFGNGGYGVWIARATGMGARVSAGLVVYFMLGDLAAVGWVATLGLVAGGRAVGGHAQTDALVVTSAIVAAVPTAAMLLAPSLPSEKLTPLLRPWRIVPRAAALAQLGVRVVAIALAVTACFAGAHAFGLAIPCAPAAAYGPAVLLVASLPVNVAGVGAVQGAWLLFFAPYAAGARILAFQVLWQWMAMAAFFARGAPFLRRAMRQIYDGRRGQ